MDRLRLLSALLAVAALVFGGLRVVHVLAPAVYPKVLAGPFALDRVEQVEEYAGFTPLLPFYRPATLGGAPVAVTAWRRPRPRAVVFWQGDHFLVLEQTRGGPAPPRLPPDRELAGHPGAAWWVEGRTHHLVVPFDELWVVLRSDLPEREVRRLVETLRPLPELL
jgi:hypothetical protein